MSENFNEKSRMPINFKPIAGPTQARLRLNQMEEAIKNLPQNEQDEFKHVAERLDFLLVKYGSSAKLAFVHASLKIALSEGQ